MEASTINQRDSQGRKQGPWEHYHRKGIIKERGRYENDKREDTWKYYYADGTLWQRHHYHHDLRHGVLERYYPDDTLCWRRHYHHDTLIREDTDKTLYSYDTIISQQGLSSWLKITDHIPVGDTTWELLAPHLPLLHPITILSHL
jgi:antitoxin component YwqK of YwqJK toxin-antitoxin module